MNYCTLVIGNTFVSDAFQSQENELLGTPLETIKFPATVMSTASNQAVSSSGYHSQLLTIITTSHSHQLGTELTSSTSLMPRTSQQQEMHQLPPTSKSSVTVDCSNSGSPISTFEQSNITNAEQNLPKQFQSLPSPWTVSPSLAMENISKNRNSVTVDGNPSPLYTLAGLTSTLNMQSGQNLTPYGQYDHSPQHSKHVPYQAFYSWYNS
ncbi:hypothetical protein QAD02_021494 [Eretmocerus hayati]|uniref:Uncharacterized protein n=1 Tax=Eretmocerus hayati TaxID=131215 RepID=A0ACC2PQC3_9HYME|nr:hypothetical protein QAD02_021494 [Eretmocerus hayati]